MFPTLNAKREIVRLILQYPAPKRLFALLKWHGCRVHVFVSLPLIINLPPPPPHPSPPTLPRMPPPHTPPAPPAPYESTLPTHARRPNRTHIQTPHTPAHLSPRSAREQSPGPSHSAVHFYP